MKTSFSSLLCSVGVLPGALFLGAAASVHAADKSQSDAFPNFESYVKISGQAASVSGNEASFQNRTRQSSDGGVGIEDLHIAKDLSKATSLVVDGKALSGSEDYLGRLTLTTAKVGSVDVGYKRFRTFYDGAGGFFPLNKQWMPLNGEDLHIDRSKFWIEAKLNLPDAPVFTFRYTNELRNGRKDSTIWGSTSQTGLPFNVAPIAISPVRKLSPSFVAVGERHEAVELSASHTIKKTSLHLTLLGDRTNNSNSRYVTNFPGEVIPWSIASLATAAQPAAKAAVAPTNWNNQVAIVETEAMKTQTTGLNFEAVTVLTDKITLRLGGNYELVHTTIGGGRPLVTQTATATGIVPVSTNNYADLSGGTRVKDYAGNIALDFKPVKTLFVKLALRAQDEFIRGSSTYSVIAASGTPATTLATTPRLGWAKIHQNVRTPVAEIRYTGIKDLALYFTGSQRDLSGVERNSSAYNTLTALNGTLANNNVSEDHGNYTLGASWRQSAMLTLRAELFQKDHQNSTSGFGVSVGDYYLLDSQYSGYKLTATVKPSAQISLTTRFVSQKGKMQVTGFLPTFPAYDSLDSKNNMISQTVDFNPSKAVYFQLNGTMVFHVISTAYPRAGVTPATATVSAFDTNRVLQNSDNNYSTASFLSGFVVDKDTDAQVQVTDYRANNGNAVLAAMTLPYGVVVRDTAITVGLKHKFSDKWIGRAKLGYFRSTNETSGGNANYHGPVAYIAFDHAL